MIHNSLKESNVDLNKCIILTLENQFNIAIWSSYLKSMLPKFDMVYSGNDYVKMLLKDSGIEVTKPVFMNRALYNATKIRSMIISGDDWEKLVPHAVSSFIKKINGKNRLSIINQSDTKPTEH